MLYSSLKWGEFECLCPHWQLNGEQAVPQQDESRSCYGTLMRMAGSYQMNQLISDGITEHREVKPDDTLDLHLLSA
ncbi:uncharacterized [Tachysurus ichikawai]